MGTARYLKENNPGIKTVIKNRNGSIRGESQDRIRPWKASEFKLAPFMDTAYFVGLEDLIRMKTLSAV